MSIGGTGSIQLLTAYRLVKQITKPWKEWEAFDLGLIDKNGKKIRDSKTPAEQNSMSLMKVLAANIKRIVQSLPGGKSKFGSLAAALFLLREELDLTDDTIELVLEKINVDIEQPEIVGKRFLHEEVYYENTILRNVSYTQEHFLGFWNIYEGRDILTGKTVRFIDEQARQK